jgi:hypothetical protein
MSSLLEEVCRDHFPYRPATPEQLEAFEQRVGWKLDPDLRAFYLHCDGAELFERRPNAPYRAETSSPNAYGTLLGGKDRT